jgi:nitrogen-specific signal transduction histidine kinase
MNVVSGLVAVLNENRQILAFNDVLLNALEVENADDALGLRPGEALKCIHAEEHPGGCGTSKYCSTCGAAIAIVTSLVSDEPVVRECVATVERNGEQIDLQFQVRCCPITYKGERFLLLFLQDTTIQQQQAALEHTFFHDVGNTIGALTLNCQLLDEQSNHKDKTGELVKRIRRLITQLGTEVEIQRVISGKERHFYQLTHEKVSAVEIFDEMKAIFASHPASIDKTLRCSMPVHNIHLVTDASLLRRILTNMLVNAFEATDLGGDVKFWLENMDHNVIFGVWNRQSIPEAVALRVFQRNFSTKSESGRGLGTYSMKLFGETYLGGEVTFTTSEEAGTVFRISLPKKMEDAELACKD